MDFQKDIEYVMVQRLNIITNSNYCPIKLKRFPAPKYQVVFF